MQNNGPVIFVSNPVKSSSAFLSRMLASRSGFRQISGWTALTLLSSCAEPVRPEKETQIINVQPEPSMDPGRLFGTEFSLIRTSRITMAPSDLNASNNPAIRFTRFSGKFIVSGGKLTKSGHRITVDSRAMETDASAESLAPLQGGAGFDSAAHPNFVISFYKVQQKGTTTSARYRVQFGDISFEGETQLRAQVRDSLLKLHCSLLLPIRQQFGAESALASYFGPKSLLVLGVEGRAVTEEEQLLTIGNFVSPTVHRTGETQTPTSSTSLPGTEGKVVSTPRNQRWFESLDRNRDGVVSKSESGRLWSNFSHFDSDKDESLTLEEFKHIRTRVAVPKIDRPVNKEAAE